MPGNTRKFRLPNETMGLDDSDGIMDDKYDELCRCLLNFVRESGPTVLSICGGSAKPKVGSDGE
eukprot:scaffold318836_cov76-Attheya_sp.AAC.4